ncbi:MAG: hypothetical protein PHU56_01690 [Candidatus Pacebacteria bacterium]|nr:hypothetical protein [Candidatus Paceibacterota bacterium]
MLRADKKIYLFVLSACLIDVLIFSLVLSPLIKRIQARSADLNNQQSILAALGQNDFSLSDFQKNIDDLKNYTDIVQSAFIDSSAPVQFLKFLEKQAARYDLQLTTSPFDSPAVKEDIWSSVGVRVKAEGDLADCLRLVEALENSQWVINITRLDLQKAASDDDSQAALSLDIRAFSGNPPIIKK